MNSPSQESRMEKEAIIDRYTEKWDKIIFSTEPVDRSKAEAIIIKAYALINLPPPTIYFLTSPSADQCLTLNSIRYHDIGGFLALKHQLEETFTVSRETVEEFIVDRLCYSSKFDELYDRGERFSRICDWVLYLPYLGEWYWQYNENFYKILPGELFKTYPWFYDFYFDSTKDEVNLAAWSTLKELCEECPYLITDERICIIIDRPSELNLDRELLPHGEAKPAVKYTDGYEIYCHHGVTISAKYGQVHPSDWRSELILLEDREESNNTDREQHNDLILVLLSSIGYKRFSQELPLHKDRYWQKDKSIRTPSLIDWSFNEIYHWREIYYWRFYGDRDKPAWALLERKSEDFHSIIKNLPCILTEELDYLYRNNGYYLDNDPIVPRLSFYPLSEAVEHPKPGLKDYLVRLFQGDRGEIYYVVCNRVRKIISPIYCRFPNAKPMIYAECVTALFAAIAECYRSGAYYISVDEITGARSIEQDLDKVEPIFEKFNPYQIDNWRKIWKNKSRSTFQNS